MGEVDRDEQPRVIRLCVDLNVWTRYLLAVRKGPAIRTASVSIVEAIKTGQCAAGPVQLVISHTMLSRLEDVLVRLRFRPGDASAFCALIGAFARRGPQGVAPHVVLGGGTSPSAESRMPVYNPYDPAAVPPRADDEDGRVLDTAVAGRAHVLANFNFADFQTPNTETLEPDQWQIYAAAHHRVFIGHAHRVAEFLRTGQLPSLSHQPTSHRNP